MGSYKGLPKDTTIVFPSLIKSGHDIILKVVSYDENTESYEVARVYRDKITPTTEKLTVKSMEARNPLITIPGGTHESQ